MKRMPPAVRCHRSDSHHDEWSQNKSLSYFLLLNPKDFSKFIKIIFSSLPEKRRKWNGARPFSSKRGLNTFTRILTLYNSKALWKNSLRKILKHVGMNDGTAVTPTQFARDLALKRSYWRRHEAGPFSLRCTRAIGAISKIDGAQGCSPGTGISVAPILLCWRNL